MDDEMTGLICSLVSGMCVGMSLCSFYDAIKSREAIYVAYGVLYFMMGVLVWGMK